MDTAEVDRKVMRAIAFKGRGCTISEIQGSWGLDKEDVATSLTRLSSRSLIGQRAGKWETADSRDRGG